VSNDKEAGLHTRTARFAVLKPIHLFIKSAADSVGDRPVAELATGRKTAKCIVNLNPSIVGLFVQPLAFETIGPVNSDVPKDARKLLSDLCLRATSVSGDERVISFPFRRIVPLYFFVSTRSVASVFFLFSLIARMNRPPSFRAVL